MENCALRVVTVAFNPGDELRACVASISEATTKPYEVVVVDNGTERDVVDEVASDYGVIVERPGRNLGYGGAANLGAQHYDGEWILVANPDLEFTPGSIDKLIEAADHWPQAGVFGPLIRTLEGDVYPSARQFPRLVSGAGHALLAQVWPGNPFTRAYRSNAAIDRAHEVDWLSGACLLIRTEAFREVGGFDDSYFMFFEDTQLGEDMRAHGWASVFIPEADVTHEQGASWKARPAKMLRAHHESAAHYLDGIYSQPWQAPLRWALRTGLRIRAEIQVALAKHTK
ncbi:glycosyltransferase family 2 protein [Arcanobacterium haemolyticum]|nr:glycosyltransferase family 2 protein [Arcanobacterium haemolyticum]